MHNPPTTESKSKPATRQAGAFFGGGAIPFFQPKLTVNQPGDVYEQEADHIADKVMRMREGDAPVVQRMFTPAVQRACAHCEEKRREEEGVQRKETNPSPTLPNVGGSIGTDVGGQSAPSIVSDVLSSGGGQAMDANTQDFMGSRMGADFSNVRIHTDGKAAESASAIQARAYTSGNNIVFGQGEYQPGTEEGKRLLAHELVHVGQQKHNNTDSIQREPTAPRVTTGYSMIVEAERILSLHRDTASTNETHRMWSSVNSNFGANTIGSIARRIWTYIFLRHFNEPEQRPGVESRHPRYFFSRNYGWVDAQHFFGFIDFAEQDFEANARNQQLSFNASTLHGLQIEERQQSIRDYIITNHPHTGPTRLLQVRPPNTGMFQIPLMVHDSLAHTAAEMAVTLLSRRTEGELFNQLNERQRYKFFTDSAKSAFTFEDFVSNQLGTRFFYLYKDVVNTLPVSARDGAFRDSLIRFFASIGVVDSQTELASHVSILPGQERFDAPHTTEALERRRHPDLFTLP